MKTFATFADLVQDDVEEFIDDWNESFPEAGGFPDPKIRVIERDSCGWGLAIFEEGNDPRVFFYSSSKHVEGWREQDRVCIPLHEDIIDWLVPAIDELMSDE